MGRGKFIKSGDSGRRETIRSGAGRAGSEGDGGGEEEGSLEEKK